MMKRWSITIPFFLVFTIFLPQLAANTVLIAGHLSPAPYDVTETVADGGAPRPKVSGIKLIYSGYSNFTNADGYFSFPKHHGANTLRIIVTTSIGYDLLKNTVNRQQIGQATPPMAIYQLEKHKEGDKPSPKKVTDGPEISKEQWYWQVTSKGTTPPKEGITSHDLVILCNPKHIYLQDGSIHYGQENAQFIIPQGIMFAVSTPKQTTIGTDDKFVQSVDVSEQKDVINDNADDTQTSMVERTIVHAAAAA